MQTRQISHSFNSHHADHFWQGGFSSETENEVEEMSNKKFIKIQLNNNCEMSLTVGRVACIGGNYPLQGPLMARMRP